MANTRPFFPLGLVAFPDEVVKLHIFEPRYKQLVKNIELSGEPMVIVPMLENRLRSYGTEVSLDKIHTTYESGELDISVRGQQVVRVRSFVDPLPDQLYAGGDVEVHEQSMNATDTDRCHLLKERCADLMRILGTHMDLPDCLVPGFSFAIGHRIGLSPKQEYRLLTMRNENDRQDFLLKALERNIRSAQKTIEMKHRIQMNGHFRYFSK